MTTRRKSYKKEVAAGVVGTGVGVSGGALQHRVKKHFGNKGSATTATGRKDFKAAMKQVQSKNKLGYKDYKTVSRGVKKGISKVGRAGKIMKYGGLGLVGAGIASAVMKKRRRRH